jgi:hypothetical protein
MGSKMVPYSAEMPAMEVMQQYGPVVKSLQDFGEGLKKEIEEGTYQKPEGVAVAIEGLIQMPRGQRPMRTVVDRQLKEALAGLNSYTDAMYQQMYMN